jgi:phosphatidylserine/phosphatidylglycerophosphate/cardiolipin synthase-like enzyme
LLVTNQNFTGAGFNSNREFGVITTDRGPVLEAIQVFESDWHGAHAPTSFQHLIVSPVNSRNTILDMINGSEKSVWLYAEVLRDEDVTDALDGAVARGVDVRLLVNPSTSDEDVPYFLDVLDHGVQVRVLNSPYVHSKALIVDGTQVLIGSQNYSFTSLDRNREVGMVLEDPTSVEIVSSTFLGDWNRAVPVDSISWTRIASLLP